MPGANTDSVFPSDLWDQLVYARLYPEIDPFEDRRFFRPLERAYTGDNSFWAMPSPEPRLSDDFWNAVAARLEDEKIRRAAQLLATTIARWEPDGDRLVFAAILRAGVPVADWLCRLFPGAKAASLSLFVGLGIDTVALAALRRRHPKRRIVFVDGWTGRGGVARTLAELDSGPLAVLVDPWGWADFSGTQEDLFCPTACFTGVATLGFSRTFFVDHTHLFGAYLFPARYRRRDLVAAWQENCPTVADGGGRENTHLFTHRFFRKTPLRIHANEVCRALINAAPEKIFFLDTPQRALRQYPFILELAEHRKVAVEYDAGHLTELRTRVACTLLKP